MALRQTSYRTAFSQQAASVPELCLSQPRRVQHQDLLERSLAMAHFVFPDRATAIAILIGAMNKLKVRAHHERKRAYWRDKFLKRQISRITRDDEDTLQWLIFFESDMYEKTQEDLGQASEEDMVVRYVKALVGFSTGMSSFYVNIAIHRLLYRYTTSETQKLYEIVTDRYREADEYRRAKRFLMHKLEVRFRNRIQSIHADRGEMKYELAENQEAWCELVINCLKLFTPWSTQGKCPLQHNPSGFSYVRHQAFGDNFEDRSNQDKIEINRCHAFIDPLCARSIVEALGLEQHSSKLGVPRFYMDPDQNLRRPSLRLPDSPLTAQERQVIADALAAEEERRRKAASRELRFVVDGVERARFDLEHSRELHFRAPFSCQLLEVWTEDERGPLLLATHIMPNSDSAHPIESEFSLTANPGRSLSIFAQNEMDGEAGCCKISVSVDEGEVRHNPVPARVREWLARAPALPIYACMLALFLAAIFLWTEQQRKSSFENDAKTKLFSEQKASASSQQPVVAIGGASTYRLTPDALIVRGSDDIQEHEIAVPHAPIVINLELPVSETHRQYLAALELLDSRKIILTQDHLTAIAQGSKTIILVSVPSILLAPSQYYRVELQDTLSKTIQSFTFYTAPAKP